MDKDQLSAELRKISDDLLFDKINVNEADNKLLIIRVALQYYKNSKENIVDKMHSSNEILKKLNAYYTDLKEFE